ncbi:uncharacterized protein LOC132728833 isoform X2 [Ruditapes philippinarum]|uniref:uncharacterized protein LOC132728833 isoform X2 n=1 Tax=Ruditapes philippinarum TaxID=129788 RepID=UPI00295C396C|nr:uncharacterized protein LOC132728833 isoform X2 [Ruditapes philippinarum]
MSIKTFRVTFQRYSVRKMNRFLLNTLVQLTSFVVSCEGFFMVPRSFNGDLTPVDPEICTTQSVTFTCTLFNQPNPKHNIGFAIKNKETKRKFIRVGQDEVKVIDESRSELTLNNLTTKTFVQCINGESPNDTDEARQIGHTSTVQIYPMPSKVEQLDCIVDNYYDSMKCSWDYGTAYKLGTFNVTFQWRIPMLSASWINCPDLNIKHGFCRWKSTRTGDFSMKIIDTKITLKQSCGISYSSTFTIDTTKIVKPDPVAKLTSTTINSTCVIVKYHTNNSQMQYPKQHKLIISNKWDEPNEITFNTTYWSEKGTHRRTVCNLHPYTTYTFSVSIQPTGDEAGYFSDSRTTEATTYSDIPSASPAVAEGGYSFNAMECKHLKSKRRICIPLKPIEEENENGPMNGIVLLVTNTDTGEQFDEEFTEKLTYVCLSDLQCNTSYNIMFKARNVNGTSEKNSSLFIPPVALVPPLEVKVEAGQDTDVYMSWTQTENATGYMVFWCRNRNGNCATRNGVDWKYFPMDTTEGIIRIKGEYFPRDFLYGVSALTETGGGGIEWQDCVYLRHADPKREPKNVVVSLGSEDNTLVVTWDKLMCKSDEPYIDMYNVRYTQLNNGNEKSLNVSSSVEARVTIRNLQYDQTYVVTVRAVTDRGHFGPESHPKRGVVKPNSKCAGVTISTLEDVQPYSATVSGVTEKEHLETSKNISY